MKQQTAAARTLERRSVRTGFGARQGGGLRLAVASDDPFSREAFRVAARAPDIEIVAIATLRALIEELDGDESVDVVLLDAQVAAIEALGALQRLRACVPHARILVFSTPESTEFGLLCLTMGASGYLSKDIDPKSLPRVLHRLDEGEAVVSRAFVAPLLERVRINDRRGRPRVAGPMTPPEQQILELLHAGRSVPEVALDLGVRPATIKRHLASARRKLTAGEGLAPRNGAGEDPEDDFTGESV